ncbi:pentatricopeptide repeat-containing protein [Gossypium australe]|uniref:Pentatricopeptide repeat-containing protein n=1 Tax=Gossypium australe TaxID=47621 RepID=A0A5B6WLD7_9ROSI|nr:pentatricopeptide repeat-containing protein [Gossypium australe]
MATSKLFAVVVPLVIIFSSLQIVTSKHAISASPAGSPYVNAPNMSSFFPSQAPPQWPDSGAFGPIPSSGEFVGKSSCTSAKPDVAILCFMKNEELRLYGESEGMVREVGFGNTSQGRGFDLAGS